MFNLPLVKQKAFKPNSHETKLKRNLSHLATTHNQHNRTTFRVSAETINYTCSSTKQCSERNHFHRVFTWILAHSGIGVIVLNLARMDSKQAGTYLSNKMVRFAFSDWTSRLSIHEVTWRQTSFAEFEEAQKHPTCKKQTSLRK